jgi:hypothetical protein
MKDMATCIRRLKKYITRLEEEKPGKKHTSNFITRSQLAHTIKAPLNSSANVKVTSTETEDSLIVADDYSGDGLTSTKKSEVSCASAVSTDDKIKCLVFNYVHICINYIYGVVANTNNTEYL